MPQEEISLGVFVGSEIGDLNRELKSAMKRLLDGDESAIHDIAKISRKREDWLKPKSIRRKND